jgi:hypothetical protein
LTALEEKGRFEIHFLLCLGLVIVPTPVDFFPYLCLLPGTRWIRTKLSGETLDPSVIFGAAMRKIQNQLVDRTLEFWQTRTSLTLTREDAREMVENITGFFRILREWEVADQPAATARETTKGKL